ncbi:MAG: cyclic nucleotide-binding domain-containing protein [Spirochaetes bacterium]|nr:cyclic nucleotide-binding domain-containing protein [Spirochaetota bacterium]
MQSDDQTLIQHLARRGALIAGIVPNREKGPMNILDYVQNVQAKQYKSGDIVFSQGEKCDGKMYFIFTGEISVIKKHENSEQVIRKIYPGEFFGEMALISSEPRAATIKVTSKESRLGIIDEAIFYKLAKNSPEFLFALLKATISRMCELDSSLDRLRDGSAEE